jgi:hypothetical protein
MSGSSSYKNDDVTYLSGVIHAGKALIEKTFCAKKKLFNCFTKTTAAILLWGM